MTGLGIDYAEMQREEARLIILKELSVQANESLSSSMMEPALRVFAIYQDRPWIHQQLDWMANMGAITVMNAGTVKIATLLPAGWHHLRREHFIDGIKRPSPLKRDV
ncbi:hypothetical protein ASD46_09480 [Rhizobium sp. Root491]|uniref:VpaChn25_0724 family phage protein n=1 Tax=Rhizobium/Agrobacterium group TaxID=227290 RepID=UPI000712B67D|nr:MULTISPECIES: hypothetical protein [Rhizobium/Agrobacterium group]KQY45340.1 hypothetical protein ASD46_09480 [Rhizobium sp. Root491]UXS52578.1 hypothetical protein FY148_07920 [Agrobacterium tumefaciens]UXS62824.1 hypothetical protein FY147_07920 [Agrobacterium tumefaciens]HAU74419.1 hypothetical protein [Agrobacterium sp.]